MACENVEPYANPVQVVLEPGKRLFKPMMRVTKSPYSFLNLFWFCHFVSVPFGIFWVIN